MQSGTSKDRTKRADCKTNPAHLRASVVRESEDLPVSGDAEEAAFDGHQLFDDLLVPENPFRDEKSGAGGRVRIGRRLPVPTDSAGPKEFVKKVVRALDRLKMELGQNPGRHELG